MIGMNPVLDIDKLLFLDIETVPQYAAYSSMPENMQLLWNKKVQRLVRYESGFGADNTAEDLYTRAGIYSEFGKIICISIGFFKEEKLYVHSYFGDNEHELLSTFRTSVTKHFGTSNCRLCGHNIKEFDIPYIARRMLINGIALPEIFNLSGKRPWENPHLDTLEMWKFGDYKHYTSLELLAAVFGIPSPKDDIAGSDIMEVYWKQNDLQRIVTYCEKDTITVVQLFLKMKGMKLVPDQNIVFIK